MFKGYQMGQEIPAEGSVLPFMVADIHVERRL
jgi:hypothetical protein